MAEDRMRHAALFLAFLLCLPIEAIAELPEEVYLEKAREAQEALRVRVLEVAEREERDEDGGWTVFDVQCEVVEVRRSAAELKPGSRVHIVYGVAHRPPGWVGPGSASALRKGEVVPAFIEPNGKPASEYRLAAGGGSFSEELWKQTAGDDSSGSAPFVVLHVEANNCGKSFEGEAGTISMKWMGDKRLRVSIWQFINTRMKILEEGAGMVVNGDDLQLTYKTRVDEPDGKPVPTCIRPVSLTFDIRGVLKRDYRVSIRESSEL